MSRSPVVTPLPVQDVSFLELYHLSIVEGWPVVILRIKHNGIDKDGLAWYTTRNGKWYGDYLVTDEPTDEDVTVLLQQASDTITELKKTL